MSNDPLKVIQVRLDVLKPHPRNVEIYGYEPIDEGLCASIREIGIDTPIEIAADYTIIKGHKRWQCAKHIGLEEVPCRIRTDLEDDYSILYSLIEDNRHQRARSPLQRQKETDTLIEIVKARRALMRDADIEYLTQAGEIDLSTVDSMSEEEGRRLDEDIAAAQETIKNPVKKNKSYDIGLAISGQPAKQYAKAKRINRMIDALRADGKTEEADEIVELATRNLQAAERKAMLATGDDAKPKPNPKKTSKATIKSQANNVLTAMKALAKMLPNQNDMKLRTAMTIVESIKKEFGQK